MKQTDLKIAGLRVRIELHDEYEGLKMPESYMPFVTEPTNDAPDVTLTVKSGYERAAEGMNPVSSGMNDLGEARLYHNGGEYAVDLLPHPSSSFRTMHISEDFTTGRLQLPGDRYAAFTVDSMLRILYSQAVVLHHGFMLHSAAVVRDGKAVLFMGKSGTGKSTHAQLWLREFAGTSLLNDDNPVVRVSADGTVTVYGSPWSGKTPCYRNAEAPVEAMVRLEQAPVNRYTELSNIDAFVAVLPGVSVITHSRKLYGEACSSVVEALKCVKVGKLECTPEPSAAYECQKGISGEKR
ncbi:uncharacterized protein BN813_01009 [Bacteroides sp. CAG:927]|nr:uncharacterized protein BN813_01009 [Bacteroides sp. CAG:927]